VAQFCSFLVSSTPHKVLISTLGIIYCFFGIQLATQNYINPAIDIIKKKGFIGAELMNVSLLAMSNSLAESFIIVNSIFFGVSDIGISTVVQQAAFYGLINQGKIKFFFTLACRHVLPHRTRRNSHRLVDRNQRDLFFLTLFSYHVSTLAGQLSIPYRSSSSASALHSAHFLDEILIKIRNFN